MGYGCVSRVDGHVDLHGDAGNTLCPPERLAAHSVATPLMGEVMGDVRIWDGPALRRPRAGAASQRRGASGARRGGRRRLRRAPGVWYRNRAKGSPWAFGSPGLAEARRGSPKLAGEPRPASQGSPVRCW
eukprot:gene16289-biopygen302